jgi:hypothetical protein
MRVNPKTGKMEQMGMAPAGAHFVTEPTPPAGPAPVDQNKLEQNYRTALMRAVSSRSGGLGLEDQKVNQANHLLGLLDQFQGHNMPNQIANELALGLANLSSPRGQAGVELMKELQYKTAQGDIAGAFAAATGDPQFLNATPEKVRQMLYDSIERQGQIAVQNREGALGYIRGLAPTDLEEARRLKLERAHLNPLRERRQGTTTPTSGPGGSAPRIRYDMNGNVIK